MPSHSFFGGEAKLRGRGLFSVAHCRACIDRQLESRWTFTGDCLDVSVGRLLIPTRRGVGGLPYAPHMFFELVVGKAFVFYFGGKS